jgi:hypothetical protein
MLQSALLAHCRHPTPGAQPNGQRPALAVHLPEPVPELLEHPSAQSAKAAISAASIDRLARLPMTATDTPVRRSAQVLGHSRRLRRNAPAGRSQRASQAIGGHRHRVEVVIACHLSRSEVPARNLGGMLVSLVSIAKTNRSGSAPSLDMIALCVLVLLSATACSTSKSIDPLASTTGTDASVVYGVLGGLCDADKHCTAGFCLDTGVCSRDCKTNADCSNKVKTMVCGIAPGGRHACVYPCSDDAPTASYVCMAGKTVACSVAGDSFCDQCGCPANKRCEVGVGCTDLSNVGGPCKRDSNCKTDHCSTYTNTCLVLAGDPCDGSNCDLCLTKGAYSYCSRPCQTDAICNGGKCLMRPGDSHATCHPPCGGSCSGCSSTTDFPSVDYCTCEGCQQAQAPPRALGQGCQASFQCQSADCFVGSDIDKGGWCTKVCDSSAACGSGFCVDVPCVGGRSATRCGKMCVPACDRGMQCARGSCRALPSAEGDSKEVCDILRPEHGSCTVGSDCQSGTCAAGSCAAAGGAPLGAACTNAQDCMSGRCSNGKCRGNSLLGDACTGNLDCAIGSCCLSTHTCGTSCP